MIECVCVCVCTSVCISAVSLSLCHLSKSVWRSWIHLALSPICLSPISSAPSPPYICLLVAVPLPSPFSLKAEHSYYCTAWLKGYYAAHFAAEAGTHALSAACSRSHLAQRYSPPSGLKLQRLHTHRHSGHFENQAHLPCVSIEVRGLKSGTTRANAGAELIKEPKNCAYTTRASILLRT